MANQSTRDVVARLPDVGLAWLLALAVCACGTDGSDQDAGGSAADTATASDALQDSGAPDAGGTDVTPADGLVQDSGASDVTDPDATTPDTVDPDTATQDTAVADTTIPDTSDPDTTAPDGAGDGSGSPSVATLLAENQTIATPYTTVVIAQASLPPGTSATGKVALRYQGGADDGKVAGWVAVKIGPVQENLEIKLAKAVFGAQAFVAEVQSSSGVPFKGLDGGPVQATLQVTGDQEEAALAIESQSLDPKALGDLTVAHVSVPARYNVGLWLAIYADKDGAPAALLGKAQFKAGKHQDQVVSLTSTLTVGQKLHAMLREGAAGSGSWTTSGAKVMTLAGQPVATEFLADSVAFHPVLEIEDQTLTDPKKMVVKKVTIPKSIYGAWVAVYADDGGKAGALVGKLAIATGTKENATLTFDVAQQGDKTLHAKLHAGQKWEDAQKVVVVAPGGVEMAMSFKIGAKSLSYILAPPTTTDNPRHIVVQRAYAYDTPAWVVVARDDGGKPGEVIARKKVLPKFAGNVHLWSLTSDFLKAGSSVDFLKGAPGTYRRYVHGDETLHVLLYKDQPEDNEFTYTPGGSEDQPVLDVQGKQVTALLQVTVKAAIDNSQKESPRYYWPCPLSQHIANPTKLPVDCRCHVNIVGLDFPECKADIADYVGLSYGEGPRARTHNFGAFRSGFAEPATNELIGLLEWKDHQTKWPEHGITIDLGAVIAIDAETRKRRVIGGRIYDTATGPVDVGSGPVLSYPFDVQKGPDGKYYVASYAYVKIDASLVATVDVIRVDPASGNREFVWRSNHLGFNLDNKPNPYGHCANGRDAKYGYASVQIGRKAFALDDKGSFYFSYAHNGTTPTSDGIGILRVSADGKTCEFVTRSKVGKDNILYKGQSVGGGFEPQAGPYKGMLIKDGKIYASTELDDDLVEVDLKTGDRKAIHVDGVTDAHNGSSGTHVVWDPYRSLIWQAGLSGSTLLFDLTTGKGEPLWCPQNERDYKGIGCVHPGAWGNNGMPLERGLWLHPKSAEYAFVVNGPIVMRVHLKSGTSEIFSY